MWIAADSDYARESLRSVMTGIVYHLEDQRPSAHGVTCKIRGTSGRLLGAGALKPETLFIARHVTEFPAWVTCKACRSDGRTRLGYFLFCELRSLRTYTALGFRRLSCS